MEMSSEKLRQQYEGQLCKYTNVVKGWQFRWFVLDPETGVLDYYLNESERKQRPRGSVHLAAAVISPSDEDSNTFTVNSATGDMFKLRAADARARHEWVSRIRSVAEMHTMAIAQSNPPLPPREHHVTPHSTSSLAGPAAQVGTRIHCSLEVLDAFSEARKHIHSADQSSCALSRTIEELPSTGHCTNVDESMLLLKATAQATVFCLGQCLSILQQQQIASAPFRSSTTTLAPAVASKKPVHVYPQQNEEYDSKKSLQHEFSSVQPDPMPESSQMLPPPASEDQARNSTNDDVTDEDDFDESDIVPGEEQKPDKSVILQLLSQLKLGMDLTRVVLPTFILEKRSLLEMFADCMGHPQLFIRIPDEETPLERMLALIKWFLTSFHVGCSDSVAKKPYNPILGEIFHCSWRVTSSPSTSNELHEVDENHSPNLDENHMVSEDVNQDIAGATETFEITYTAEQVSHHPPVTAFYVECPGKKMYLNASIYTKSNFSGMSIGVNMVGELSLTLLSHGERYDFNLPSAYARSIIEKPWMELGGKVSINCPSTHLSSVIIFHAKPFYGGKPHVVTAELKNETGAIAYRVQGEWNSHYDFISSSGDVTTIKVNEIPVYKKRVKSLSKQQDNESRKLWSYVTKELRAGNIHAATKYKQRLEEKQRVEEKLRKDSGQDYTARYFHEVDENWIFNTTLHEE